MKNIIGYSFKNKAGGVNTVILDTKKKYLKSRCNVYEVTCSICSQDKILFPYKFYGINSKLSLNHCPCGCSGTYKYNDSQVRTLCIRKATTLKQEFIGFDTQYFKTMLSSKVEVKCKHKTHKNMNVDSYLRVGINCVQCTSDGISLKLKLPENITIYSYVGNGVYYYTCSLCSEDYYVKNFMCTGIFKITRSQVKAHISTCRCNLRSHHKTLHKNYILYELNIRQENNKNISVISLENYKCGILCTLHGKSEQRYDSTVKGITPLCCSISWAKYKGRLAEMDYLYMLKLTLEDEEFIKVGRSFTPESRISSYEDVGYSVEVLYIVEDRHSTIDDIEYCFHKTFKPYKYLPSIYFGGCSKECYTINILSCGKFKYFKDGIEIYWRYLMEDTLTKFWSSNSTKPPESTSDKSSATTSTNVTPTKVTPPKTVTEPILNDEFDDEPF